MRDRVLSLLYITWCSRSRRYLRGCVTIFNKDFQDVRGPPHLTHTGEFEAVLSLGRKTLRTSCGRWSAEAHLQARTTHQHAPRALCRLPPPRDRVLYHTIVRVRRWRPQTTKRSLNQASAASSTPTIVARRTHAVVFSTIRSRFASRRNSPLGARVGLDEALVEAPREQHLLFGSSESPYHTT